MNKQILNQNSGVSLFESGIMNNAARTVDGRNQRFSSGKSELSNISRGSSIRGRSRSKGI